MYIENQIAVLTDALNRKCKCPVKIVWWDKFNTISVIFHLQFVEEVSYRFKYDPCYGFNSEQEFENALITFETYIMKKYFN